MTKLRAGCLTDKREKNSQDSWCEVLGFRVNCVMEVHTNVSVVLQMYVRTSGECLTISLIRVAMFFLTYSSLSAVHQCGG